MPFCQLRVRAWNPIGTGPGLPAIRVPNPPRTLGEHLLVTRYERGLRQQDAAREIGVDEFTLLNWENGKTSPALRHRPSIYRWLGYCPVSPRPATLGERLFAWRIQQGFSQAAVTLRLERDPGTVHRLEQRVGTPTRAVRRAVERLIE